MPVRSPLRFAEDLFPAPNPIRQWEHFWEYLDSQRAALGKPLVPRPTGHNPDVIAKARVDEGRWIADCPWRCGAAFTLPRDATWMWCTECAGGGWGLSCALRWPENIDAVTSNVSTWPAILQFWPCAACRNREQLCELCDRIAGKEVSRGNAS
ncbi:hypothetical protein [Nonomuraea sp. CA-141351]|uniref:hypothetical protein n=1 Tax=Nonomuraea sp. CA-141351 TaxID=3239996 RepID=UPI003D8EC6A5